MDTLLRMQASYDIAQTRKREKLIRVCPLAASGHRAVHISLP
jgi:hypothetical protein